MNRGNLFFNFANLDERSPVLTAGTTQQTCQSQTKYRDLS